MASEAVREGAQRGEARRWGSAQLSEARERIRALETALRAVADVVQPGMLQDRNAPFIYCWCGAVNVAGQVLSPHAEECEEAARLVGREVPNVPTLPAAVPLPSEFPRAVTCPHCGHRGEPGGVFAGHPICDYCGDPLDESTPEKD